jgi:hypothetical protein
VLVERVSKTSPKPWRIPELKRTGEDSLGSLFDEDGAADARPEDIRLLRKRRLPRRT